MPANGRWDLIRRLKVNQQKTTSKHTVFLDRYHSFSWPRYEIYEIQYSIKPILAAAPSKTQICSLSITGIASSNPAQGMDVHLFSLLCVVQVVASAKCRSLFQRSSTDCVCLPACDLESSKMRRSRLHRAVIPQKKILTLFLFCPIASLQPNPLFFHNIHFGLKFTNIISIHFIPITVDSNKHVPSTPTRYY